MSFGNIGPCRWFFGEPWDRPYQQNTGPDRFNLNWIAGAWDKYIDDWADAAKAFLAGR